MTKTQELLELAERCEKATGPDRDLDMAICLALDTGRRVTGDGRWLGPDEFTASLDAAMTLVPEGSSWNLHKHSRWARAGVFVDDGRDAGHYCDCATPALALCAASLRARCELS